MSFNVNKRINKLVHTYNGVLFRNKNELSRNDRTLLLSGRSQSLWLNTDFNYTTFQKRQNYSNSNIISNGHDLGKRFFGE